MPLGLTVRGKWNGINMSSPLHSLKHERNAYSTPQPVENTPSNNECRMVEVRGAKVASFILGGDEFICLPQAFDLFLKHLVGGLHTVYTKLKRLNITPVVCNVEQVRILRGLGAIQPGVNRCKLITRKDFEILYQDCTQASRPGRPPKRYPMLPPTADLVSVPFPGLRAMTSHGGLNPHDFAALHKRMRMDQEVEQYDHREKKSTGSPQRDALSLSRKDLSASGTSDMQTNAANLYLQAQQVFRQQHQQVANSRLQNTIEAQQAVANAGMNPALAPLMMMTHPSIFSAGFPQNMLNQLTQLAQAQGNTSSITNAAAVAAAQIAVNGGNMQQQAAAAYQVAAAAHSAAQAASMAGASLASSGESIETNDRCDSAGDATTRDNSHQEAKLKSDATINDGNCHTSASTPQSNRRDLSPASSCDDNGKKENEAAFSTTIQNKTFLKTNGQSDEDDSVFNEQETLLNEDFKVEANISSMQSLLTNIQGLLKVAADNAKLQEKQSSFEIAELKSQMSLERKMRENAEKKLEESEKIRDMAEKSLSEERKKRETLEHQLVMVDELRSDYTRDCKDISSRHSIRHPFTVAHTPSASDGNDDSGRDTPNDQDSTTEINQQNSTNPCRIDSSQQSATCRNNDEIAARSSDLHRSFYSLNVSHFNGATND